MAVFSFTNAKELRDMIANYEGFSWGTLKSRTALGINKKSRPDKDLAIDVFGPSGITSFGTSYLGVGYDYRTSVLNKRAKQSYVEDAKDWEPNSLPWGHWWNGSKVIIEHTKKGEDEPRYYMRITYNSANSFKNKSELFINDGKTPIPEELKKRIHEFQAPKKPSKPAEDTSQGLDDEDKIEVRVFELNNILELSFGGDTFIKS